jgi:hypothetical protein
VTVKFEGFVRLRGRELFLRHSCGGESESGIVVVIGMSEDGEFWMYNAIDIIVNRVDDARIRIGRRCNES